MIEGTASKESSGAPSEATNAQSESVNESDGSSDDIVTGYFLETQTAESYLDAFETIMAPHFPFVVVPTHLPAHQLRHEWPCLFLAILASASHANVPL